MGEPTPLAVHRCRFVDYAPSAITALALPPLPLPSPSSKSKGKGREPEKPHGPVKFGTLAVGRANGDIELCEWAGGAAGREVQAPQAWVVRKVLAGPRSSKVDALAFCIRYPERMKAGAVPALADLRLFSSGGGSELVEWDLERCCVRRTLASQGGSIWSLAPNPACSALALGCEDGSVRVLDITHDTLAHARRFDRAKARHLSVAWGPPVPRSAGGGRQASASKSKNAGDGENTGDGESDSDSDGEEDEEWEDAWLVTGGSDSSVRKWDVKSGRVVERMGTDKMRGERTLVWAVGVLGDGTIVSGDSLGMVSFWDSRTCTQLQSFKGHNADVLCLTVGPDGTTVYTSGVDQKVTQFALIHAPAPSTPTSTPTTRWAQLTSRRLHSHDVRALATWPPHAPLPPPYAARPRSDVAPVLVSGGLDMSAVCTPAALPFSAAPAAAKAANPLATSAVGTFEDAYHRRLAYANARPGAVCVARGARLVVCLREGGVGVWRIREVKTGAEEEGEGLVEEREEAPWEKVLEMELSVQTNIIAGAISDDGRWLVVADLYETKLFRLHAPDDRDIHPKRIRNFTAILKAHLPDSARSTGGSAFAFSQDSTKLVMATSLEPYVLVIDLAGEEPRVLRRFDQHAMQSAAPGERATKAMPVNGNVAEGGDVDMPDATDSDDGDEPVPVAGQSAPTTAIIKRIAISHDGQWLATADDHCRTNIFNLDLLKHHCALPSFPHPPQVLAFIPSSPSMLVLGFPDNSLHVFDAETRTFPEAFRTLCSTAPHRFTTVHDPILGLAFDARGHAWFWGATWMCKVALDAGQQRKKRHLEGGAADEGDEKAQRNFKMVTQYRPLLLVDFVETGEMVVVERPLVDVLATLPPAYFKHKYGMT